MTTAVALPDVAWSESCTWCGGVVENPTGVYLSLIANGRHICVACGRFTLHCECPKATPRLADMGPQDVRLTLISVPGLVD